ncbi:MAG: hypothetical protein KC646_05005 [Candidatus Cloacimonetes bacterium]|nr:hypothetical protein [Candidatus Cloacimonadota bacterium]
MKTNSFFLLFIACVVNCYAKQDYLQEAHSAYSQGKFRKLSKSLKRVFETNPQNSPKVDNAKCLLSQVFNFLKSTPLPVEYRLPKWLSSMQVKSSATEVDGKIRNYIELKGLVDSDAIISKVELIQYPSKRILNSKDNSSTFKMVPIDQGQSKFSFKRILNNSLKDGLYYINMYSLGQKPLKAWVILKTPSIDHQVKGKTSVAIKNVKKRHSKKEGSIFDVAPCPLAPNAETVSLELVEPALNSRAIQSQTSRNSYGVNRAIRSIYNFGPIGVEFEYIKELK